jgi:exosortase A
MTAVPLHWRRPLVLLALLWVTIAVLFQHDIGHMAGIWWSSSTYNHILIVPPLIVWLVMQRAALIAPLRPAAWWPGVGLVAAAGAVWIVGAATDIALLRHAGTVLLLMAAVAAALGPVVVRALAFPLAYALFLVPFGDELMPLFQDITAHICMILLAVSGIPAQLDRLYITTPSGQFIVAEACSGVMFLVAMAAFATLAAHLCFRRWKRRIIFVAAALLMTIIANGLRGFGTILIAENFGHAHARGMDHLIFGWLFFAVVLLAIMLAARHWFDRPADDIAVDMGALSRSPTLAASPTAVGLAAVSLLTILLAGGTAAVGGARDMADRVVENR